MSTYYVINAGNSINNTAVNGQGLQLAAGDNILIQNTGSVLATGSAGTGIYLNAYDTGGVITVAGLVLGTQMGIYSLGQNAQINVSGQVYGGLSAQGSGSIVTIASSGYVSGDMSLDGPYSLLVNDGTINLGNGQFQIDNGVYIHNNGLISGGGQGIFFDGDGAVAVVNSGRIDGGFQTYYAAPNTASVSIDNSGIWAGPINLSPGIDTVTNTGTFNGGIGLGGGNDTLDSSNGIILGGISGGDGNDYILGGASNDIISGGTGADTLDGGGGVNTLDYSGSLLSVTVDLGNNFAKHGDAAGDHIAHFQNVYGSLKGDTLSGDAGNNVINGLMGNDTLNGNAGDDTLLMLGKGKAHINGGAGNDVIQLVTVDPVNFGPAFSIADQIDGGSGFDTLLLSGAANIAFTATTLVNVELLQMADGFNYSVVSNDATVAAGQTLIVDGTALTGSNQLYFSGVLETNGNFSIDGGDAKDTIVGGAGNDVIAGNGNADILTGGSGSDVFVFNDSNDSTGPKYDLITDFNATLDKIQTPDGVNNLDAMVSSGTLSSATFNGDLKVALNGHLLAGDAIVFKATAGTLSGHSFLVVDANGTAGYQSGDYVIDVTGYTGTFVIGDFA